jgi:hypothetical protein
MLIVAEQFASAQSPNKFELVVNLKTVKAW